MYLHYISNQLLLSNELYKKTIEKFKRRRVCSSFKGNIWGVDLADMQLISKYNKGIRYLLRGIGFFSKYAWVVLLKDKKGITIVNASKYLRQFKNKTKQNMV